MSLPADIGNGIVVASFGADGSWLSIGTTDEDLGFVELNGLPRFDEAKRSHLAEVRRYRRLMADPDLAVLTVTGASVVGRTAPVGRRVVEQRYVADSWTRRRSVRRASRPTCLCRGHRHQPTAAARPRAVARCTGTTAVRRYRAP